MGSKFYLCRHDQGVQHGWEAGELGTNLVGTRGVHGNPGCHQCHSISEQDRSLESVALRKLRLKLFTFSQFFKFDALTEKSAFLLLIDDS